MRFIEVKEGVSIDIDQIESLEKKDDFTTTVYTHHHVYEASFPYMALLQLLEMETQNIQESQNKQQETVINPYEQHWAG